MIQIAVLLPYEDMAEKFGISTTTRWRKMKEYGIES